jgi:hypothetical protein
MVYTTPGEVKSFAKIKKEDFGYSAEDELDSFISQLITYAEGLISDYTGQTWDSQDVPQAVKYVSLQLCSNILHGILQRKVSPIIQTGDYTIRLVIPEAFTDELKRLLEPYRTLTVKREGEP